MLRRSINISWRPFAYFLPLLATSLWGNPKGAQVSHGKVAFHTEGKRLDVHASDRSVIQWDTFSIKEGEATHFVQPSSDAVVFNRVSRELSQIDGFLQANGRVYLFNSSGVVIGPDGHVLTNGFLATTLDTEISAFLKGEDLLFEGMNGAKIVNLGKMEAKGGDVFLFAKGVENQGEISAPEGTVGLASGTRLYLKMEGTERIFISPTLSEKKEGVGVENSGTIRALQAELRADGNPYRFAINHSGVIEAKTTHEEGGKIYLVADGGDVHSVGQLRAERAGRMGGTVHLLGERVRVGNEGEIDVSGDFGGGTILIGGDFQGCDPEIPNSRISLVEKGASLISNARIEGDGGRIIVWSDGCTGMQGHIEARGGERGGNGGFVEVSGLSGLEYGGFVDTFAPCGTTGDLLLDPTDITVSDLVVDDNIAFNVTTGTYSASPATSNTATLENSSLVTTLQGGVTGSNVTITTVSSGTGAGNITINGPLSYTSDDNSLTFNAERDIVLKDTTIANGAGTGSPGIAFIAGNDIVLDASVGATGATFTTRGSIDFEAVNDISIPLTEPGESFVVTSFISDVRLLAGNTITIGPPGGGVGGNAEITSVVGSFILESGGDTRLTSANGAGEFIRISVGLTGSRFDVGGDLLLTGGTDTENAVTIANDFAGQGDVTFDVLGDVVLTGGSGARAYAAIGPQPVGGTFIPTGTIRFENVGGDLTLQGGTGASGSAQIGYSNLSEAASYTATGSVVIENVGGTVTLNGGTGGAVIGHGNPAAGGGGGDTESYSGNVQVDVTTDVVLNPGTADAVIGFAQRIGPTTTIGASLVEVEASTLSITGGTGGRAIVGLFGGGLVDGGIGLVSTTTTGDTRITPGTGAGTAMIGAFNTGRPFSSDVSVQARNLFVIGNVAATPTGAILAGDISSATTGNIDILADNIFVGVGTAGSDSALIQAGDSIVARANIDMILGFSTNIATGVGDVALVVDNAFPELPDKGPGRFILEAGADITSASAMRIFTAQRPQNEINAPINGAIFVPGPFLVQTSTEQWDVYFPSSFGGFPFTIFYKPIVIPDVQNVFGAAIGETSQNLRTYDNFVFHTKCFLFGYDDSCYDAKKYHEDMVSGWDFYGIEAYQMLRPLQRNFHVRDARTFDD